METESQGGGKDLLKVTVGTRSWVEFEIPAACCISRLQAQKVGACHSLVGTRAGVPHPVQDLGDSGPVMPHERTRRGSPLFLV